MNDPIKLEIPIKRGETEITEVTLRRPKSGELRGVSLIELLQMNVDAVSKVLPRISDPSLTPFEVSELDPADLVKMGAEVSSFLVPKVVLLEVAAMQPPSQLQ
ncbi:MAG: phage tail assembly protein [Rhodocyclaceae bacterium]|nr:phage tail assembly protein [Rhodocyclaceae bacterium]